MGAFLFWWVAPVALGAGSQWVSNRCRGRNAQKAFRYSAWAFWLLLLPYLPLGFFIPLIGGLIWGILGYVPSLLLFLAAGNSMLKEMRAQQNGEYTEKAI